MKIAYIGNFKPEHSTENDLADTMRLMHIDVTMMQEDNVAFWRLLWAEPEAFDAILWTSTRDLAEQIPRTMQLEMLYQARRKGIPTIGVHLDRWWGLERWRSVLEAPFFRCEFVFTADGAHQEHFKAAGVNHFWSPPAIAPRNVGLGEPQERFQSDIAFVGSWQGGYHREWQHRYELVEFLRKTYGNRVKFWPRKGEPAIRGKDLQDLYASVKVVVGDSCLVPTVDGDPMHHYCSDRVFETIGRGGLLFHPFVDGVVGHGGLLEPGVDLVCWELGDFAHLRKLINTVTEWSSDERQQVQRSGYEHVAVVDTYANRLERVFHKVGLDGYKAYEVTP